MSLPRGLREVTASRAVGVLPPDRASRALRERRCASSVLSLPHARLRRAYAPCSVLRAAWRLCCSSTASAAAAQHARSLLRERRRRLPGAHRRRRIADRVCDPDSGAAAYRAAAGGVRLRCGTRRENPPRCAVRTSTRCGFSIGHVRESAFPDVSGRRQRASAGLRTSGSGRAPGVGRSLCVPRCAASWCRSCPGLLSASQAQHQPGAREQQAGAGAGDHRQDLLQRNASHVSDHVLLEPRCEAAAFESAASKTVALSYSSWRFHHW
jgi:hypothetical protein